jgi:REP element-mobilizing transposase RayT
MILENSGTDMQDGTKNEREGQATGAPNARPADPPRSGTGVSPVKGVSSGTGVSPVKGVSSGTGVSPVKGVSSGTGVSRVKGVRAFTATRRNLPHWEEPGSVYLVTWNTFRKTRLTPEERTFTLAAIRHWDSVRWEVYSAVVMADHVHLLVQPLRIADEQLPAWYPLGSILHSVKSYSAHRINRLRGRSGAVRQDEREDRIIRSEKELWEKWQYLRDNPVKEGLAATAEEYPWFYQQTDVLPEESSMMPR